MTNKKPLPVEMLEKRAKEQPNEVYLLQPENGNLNTFTWGQVWEQACQIAAALYNIGLKKGDKVAIVSKNCAEWFIADYAIQIAGMISAPCYPSCSSETLSHILNHSESKAIFVGKLDEIESINNAVPSNVVTISMGGEDLNCNYTWTDLITRFKPIENICKAKESDLFTIAYTSGSSGSPKGVELTFGDASYAGIITGVTLQMSAKDRVLSYLPLAHLLERSLIELQSLFYGFKVFFVENQSTFIRDLQRAQPTFFASVPRLWLKFQSQILAKLPQEKIDTLLKIPVINYFVRKKIQKKLGLHKARFCGTGSALTPASLIEWYDNIGIQICEAWGMTETVGVVTLNYPFNIDKVGSIGRKITDADMKLSEEGEILVKGEGVFKRYHKDPDKTATDYRDGWFHTGDKAKVDNEGYYYITGRIKDIFKTAKGKYVAPLKLEAMLFENQYTEHACVIGNGLPQPIGLIVLQPELKLTKSIEDIERSFKKTLDSANENLEHHERFGKLFLVFENWSCENGYLTPTMKVKRDVVEKEYALSIEKEDRKEVILIE